MLVFSSALSTYSSGSKGAPSHQPAYRSNTRAALTAKSGARGKIQERNRQGLRARRRSQRQRVLRLMRPTLASCWTTCWMSAKLERLSGCPRCAGSSQATAVAVASTRGGKNRRAPSARPGGQGRQREALASPALAPVAHPVGMLAQLLGRDGTGDVRLGCQQQGQLSPLDQAMGGAGLTRHVLERGDILRSDLGLKGRVRAGHGTPPPTITYLLSGCTPTYATLHLARLYPLWWTERERQGRLASSNVPER